MIFPESMRVVYKHQLLPRYDAVIGRRQWGSRFWWSHSQLSRKAPLDQWPAIALLLAEWHCWPKVSLMASAFPGRVSDSQPSRDTTAQACNPMTKQKDIFSMSQSHAESLAEPATSVTTFLQTKSSLSNHCRVSSGTLSGASHNGFCKTRYFEIILDLQKSYKNCREFLYTFHQASPMVNTLRKSSTISNTRKFTLIHG